MSPSLIIWLVPFTVAAITTAQAREFRSSDVQAISYPTAQAVAYISKVISQRTAGRLSIKVLAQSTQGSEKFTAGR